MGCWYSRLDSKEMVSRCKARKRYVKQLVKARHSFSAAHSMYLLSLRNTGSALLQFATSETTHHRIPPPVKTPPPPPPPPMSPSQKTSWSNSTSTTASSIHPPPPPPPVATSSSPWDFWYPFDGGHGSAVDHEGEMWEESTAPSEAAVDVRQHESSDLAVVVSTKGKYLLEIIKELDDYFLKAANAAGPLSATLEVPIFRQISSDHGKSAFWSYSARWNAFGKFCEESNAAPLGNAGHCSTVERLYAWEKKLYLEVKNAEQLKSEHEKKADILRKLELKNADYIKTEKAKKEVEKLESQMMVALQAIETTSTEIIKLRESKLYPQLLELVKGLTSMWRSMYEFHQVQTHIAQQLKYLNLVPSDEPTSEILQQSTLQLELEAQKWHLSFCSLIKAQRDYVQSLTGWLRLSLFQVANNPPLNKDSAIYSLCEEWQLTINNAPDKVASEGIKSFLATIHAIVVQQAEEQKQKRLSDSAAKEFERKNTELRSLESKMPRAASGGGDPVREKTAKVDILRAKAQDEKAKYGKAISVTRAMTINNLQICMPHVFQAMTGFANVCTQAFESLQNQAKTTGDLHNVKMLLP